MGCSPSPDRRDGYATAAALGVSLALGLVAAAVTARSVAALKLAKADLRRTQADYALNGAQALAVAAIVTSGQPGPYRWTLTTPEGAVEALAEPEGAKLSLTSAAGLDDGVLRLFAVGAPSALRAKLQVQAERQLAGTLDDLDASPIWRSCASSFISPFGLAAVVTPMAYRAPGAGPHPASWHIGEVWRIRITDHGGWRDDRFVRFTGDVARPAAVISRRLVRIIGAQAPQGDGSCEKLFIAAHSA